MNHKDKCNMAVAIINQNTGLNIHFEPVPHQDSEGTRYRFTVTNSWAVTEAVLDQSMDHRISISENMTEAVCNHLAGCCEMTASELKMCGKWVKE